MLSTIFIGTRFATGNSNILKIRDIKPENFLFEKDE
jgi:hypothetical protein